MSSGEKKAQQAPLLWIMVILYIIVINTIYIYNVHNIKKKWQKKLYLSKILGKKKFDNVDNDKGTLGTHTNRYGYRNGSPTTTNQFYRPAKKKSVNYRSTARRQRQKSMKNCFDYNHNRLCYVYGYFYDENVFMRTTFIVKWHGFSFGNNYLIVNKNSV